MGRPPGHLRDRSPLAEAVMSPTEEPRPPAGLVSGDEPSDHALLRCWRGGSQDAATQLYRRYAHRLRSLAKARCSPDLARRVEAEDIVQSVFATFFRGAGTGRYVVPAGE